jgi:hypothetical protein
LQNLDKDKGAAIRAQDLFIAGSVQKVGSLCFYFTFAKKTVMKKEYNPF